MLEGEKYENYSRRQVDGKGDSREESTAAVSEDGNSEVTDEVKMVKDKRPVPPKEFLTVSGIRKTPLCSGDWVDSACNIIETNRLEVDAINVRGRKAIKRRKVC